MVDVLMRSEDPTCGETRLTPWEAGPARDDEETRQVLQRPRRIQDKAAPPISPLNLFQERYRDEPWKLLCCVIMLNMTSGRQLEPVHLPFFRAFPDPIALGLADPVSVEPLIGTLGLQRRRARSLVRMSAHYAFIWDGNDPRSLPGIGEYGDHSYRLFIRGELELPFRDKELKKYLEWRRTLSNESHKSSHNIVSSQSSS